MEYKLTCKLIRVKLYAAATTSKLQGIEQIREAWETAGGQGFSRERVELGVEIDYAIEACEAVIDLAEQLLRNPPPYNQNPDERRQRLIELDILCARSYMYCSTIHTLVGRLYRRANRKVETRVEELHVKVGTMEREARMNLMDAKCSQSNVEDAAEVQRNEAAAAITLHDSEHDTEDDEDFGLGLFR